MHRRQVGMWVGGALVAALLAASWTGVARLSGGGPDQVSFRTPETAAPQVPISAWPTTGAPTTQKAKERAAAKRAQAAKAKAAPTAAPPKLSNPDTPSGTGIPILPGAAVGVPAGDYLLTATGVVGTPGVVGSLQQQVPFTAGTFRNADFHVSSVPQTITAEVRTTSPLDSFTIVYGHGIVSAAHLRLTPATWSYLVRGQAITSPTARDLQLHGINAMEMMGIGGVRAMFGNFPADGVARLMINEQCWEPFFTTAQGSKECNAFNANGSTASLAYRARAENVIKAIEDQGRPVIVAVGTSGRDDPTWVNNSEADIIAPDQHTLAVYDDLVAKYANDPQVIFETFNEPKFKPQSPYPPSGATGATLWRDGGLVTIDNQTWTAPGEQQIVNRIRAAGAANMIMIQGPQWGEDLTPVLRDPIDGSNLVYSYHAYNPGQTNVSVILDTSVAPAFAAPYRYAGFMSEFGTLLSGSQGAQFLNSAIGWAEAHHTGWAAWGWIPDAWDNYGLLTSYSPLSLNAKGQTVIGKL